MFQSKYKQFNILYYLLLYLAIIMLIIGVLGGYLYRFYRKTAYSDFCAFNKQYVHSVAQRHENEVQIMGDIVTQMSLSVEDRQFMLQKDGKKATELISNLRQYAYVSQSFSTIVYQNREDDYLYNHNSSFRTDDFLKTGCLLGQTSSEELREILLTGTPKMRILPEQTVSGLWFPYYLDKSSEAVIYTNSVLPDGEETLLFFVPNKYYDTLFSSENQKEYRSFLYYNGEIIVSRGDQMISDAEILEILKESVAKATLTKQVKVRDGDWLLTLETGESGVIYGMLQSMQVFEHKVIAGQTGVLVVILLAVVLMMVVMFSSRPMIRKIKHINALLHDEESYDLIYIENGIQSLMEDRNATDSETVVLKQTRFVRNFVRGDYKDRDTAVEEAKKAQLRIDHSYYVVFLIRYRDDNNEKEIVSEILDFMKKQQNADGYGVRMISNNQNLFVLFGDSKEKMEADLLTVQDIVRRHCEEYVFAVSNFHEDFAESAAAYLEADTAFDNHLLMDSSKIIYFSDIAVQEHVNILTDAYLQRLKYAIRGNDFKTVEPIIKEVCNKMSNSNASLYAFRVLYNDIIHVLVSEWKGIEEKMDKYYNVFTLSHCMNVNDFYDVLCGVCKMIIDEKGGRSWENSQIVKDAIHYMEQNFKEPNLNMSTLAEELNISSVTLSVEFKNEMGINPSEYLYNLRVEKAKELLANTDMLIKDVSLEVGYMDARVFMHRFKKQTGMTLSQYRATIREKE